MGTNSGVTYEQPSSSFSFRPGYSGKFNPLLQVEYPCPPELLLLKTSNLFVIQQNFDTGCFDSYKTHEIMNEKKQVLFKGSQDRRFLVRILDKVVITNNSGKRIITVEFETDVICTSEAEAVISVPPKNPLCQVFKYGGLFAAPSFEIKDNNNQVIFAAEPKQHATGGLEYQIKTSKGQLVAHVGIKSGINCVLNTSEKLKPTDKAILIGFVIALDVLKKGKPTRRKNKYEYQ